MSDFELAFTREQKYDFSRVLEQGLNSVMFIACVLNRNELLPS